MNGKHQITRTTTIDAGRSAVWAVIEDTSLLPRWVPAVVEVLDSAGRESEGAVRTCAVSFGGRSGQITERCVEFEAPARAAFVVDGDTLGFTKMFSDYGFSLTLAERGPRATTVMVDTHYTPRNAVVGVLNAVVMRRRFARVVDELLAGLKDVAEERARTAGAS